MDAPRHDPLIEAAIRTVPGEEERRQAGAAYLQMLREDRTGGEAEIIGRWDLPNPKKAGSQTAAKVVLLLLLTILIGWAAFLDFSGIYEVLTGRDLIFRYASGTGAAETRLYVKLNPAQRQLLFGDFSMKLQPGRKEALYRSAPDNPAYYSEYAVACLAAGKPLPPDFIETARRIDPENAWFTYLAAADEAKDLERVDGRSRTLVGGKWVSIDPVARAVRQRDNVNRAVAILRDARTQVNYETYASEMLRLRLAVLPHDTRQRRQDSLAYLENNVGPAALHMGPVARALSEKAWLAVEGKNEADMREVITDAELLFGNLLDGEIGMLREELVNRGYISQLVTQIASACDQLGLVDEAARWYGVESRLLAWAVARKDSWLLVDGVPTPRELKSGAIEGFDAFTSLEELVVNPLPLTDADLAPRRYLDHEHLSHFCLYLSWAVLAVVCVILFLYRYFVPKVIRALAGRMAEQMNPVDWAYTILAGVFLPFLFVLAINRLTPLGGRDYGVAGSLGLLPASHFFALVILWLIVPVWLVHWRLGKRLGIFGFGNWDARATGFGVACVVAFLFFIKWAAITGTLPSLWVRELDFPNFRIEGRPVSEAPLWIAAGILAIPLLWLLYGTGAALLSATRRTLYRATAARVLIPVYASAMVLCLMAVPFFKIAENYWFLQDAMNRFDPAMPSRSRYEYRVAVQVRKELRVVMGYEISPNQMGK